MADSTETRSQTSEDKVSGVLFSYCEYIRLGNVTIEAVDPLI